MNIRNNTSRLFRRSLFSAVIAVTPAIAKADWAWSPNVSTLSSPGLKATNIRLASDSRGNVSGIWLQSTSPGAGYDESWLVQSARFNPAADTWGSASMLGNTGRGLGIPVLAVDEIRAWALWRSENGGTDTVQASLYEAGQWAKPITLSAGNRSSVEPEVVADGAGGFAGIWKTQPQPGVIQRTQTVGAGLQWATPVDVSPVNQDADSQLIVRNFGGGSSPSTMTLWRTTEGAGKWAILSSRSDKPGENQRVSPPGGYISNIHAASDAGGSVIAVWESHTGDDEHLIQSARWSSGQWSQPVTLSAAGKMALRPVIAARENNVTALWVMDSGTGMVIQSARYEHGAWGNPLNVGSAGSSNPAREGGYPQLVADTDGQAIAIWQHRNNQGVTVHSARFASGQWSQAQTVGTGGQDNAFPQIASAGHDTAGGVKVVAAWLQDGVVVSTTGSENSAPTFSLTLVKSGDGKIVSDPEGIDCGTTCNADFAQGQYVFLFATPGPGQVVGGWSGDCAQFIGPPRQSCMLTMNASKRVGVTFRSASARTHTVNAILNGDGKGGITSDPAGIACSNDPQGRIICNAQIAEFEENTRVTLTADAAAGSFFSTWSGACKGKHPVCTFRVGKQNRVIKAVATFQPNPTLAVQKRGTGAGSIRSDNGSIDCGTACSASFDKGAVVTLTATPESRFTGWGGACSGKREVCRVTLGKSKKVVANWIGMDTMSGNDVVPEFCIKESPKFNAAQCWQLQAGSIVRP